MPTPIIVKLPKLKDTEKNLERSQGKTTLYLHRTRKEICPTSQKTWKQGENVVKHIKC